MEVFAGGIYLEKDYVFFVINGLFGVNIYERYELAIRFLYSEIL